MTKEEFIEKIEYNQEWLEYGFLPISFIEEQIDTWLTSGDRDIEHYKWAGYQYIFTHENFSDKKRLEEFFVLIENDPNDHLYKGAVTRLIQDHIVDLQIFRGLGKTRFSDDQKIWKKLYESAETRK